MDIFSNHPDQNDYILVVAEDESAQVVGFLSFGPAALTEGTYFLYWIAVDPDSASHGYGTELMDWMEKQIRSRSGRMVLLETSTQTSYAGAHGFYRHRGYREASRIAHFYKPGDDRLTFVKYFKQEGGSHD